MKKPSKGFTLVEVIISIALLSIIALGFLSAMAGQFTLLSRSKNITSDTFATQLRIEQKIDEVKKAFSIGAAPTGVPSQTFTMFSKPVTGYTYVEPFFTGSSRSFYTVIADTRDAAGYPVPITSDILTYRKNAIEFPAPATYSDVPGLDIHATWAPIMSTTGYLHRWYVSRPGFYIPTVNNPGGDSLGGEFPYFPYGYQILDTILYRNRDLAADFSQYKGKHIVHTVTPVSVSGKMGETYFSDALYLSGLPAVSSAAPVGIHLDASLITNPRAVVTVVSGGSVTTNYVHSWEDIGNSAGLTGRDATAVQAAESAQPLLIAESVGSVVDLNGEWINSFVQYNRFDGVDDSLEIAAHPALTMNNMTMFVVARTQSDVSTDVTASPKSIIGSLGSTGVSWRLGWDETNTLGIFIHDATGAVTGSSVSVASGAAISSGAISGAGLDGDWHVLQAALDGPVAAEPKLSFRIDGGDPIEVARDPSLVIANNPIRIGADIINGNTGIDVAEVIFISGVVTQTDRDNIMEYLSNKYQPITPTLTIASLQKMNDETVVLGGSYTLPAMAKATMSNGGTSLVDVFWNDASGNPVNGSVDTTTTGASVYTATATATANVTADYPAPVTKTKTVKVLGIKSLNKPDDIHVVIHSGGGQYTISSKVVAVLEDDSTKLVDAIWDPAIVSTEALTGTTPLTSHGTLAGTGIPNLNTGFSTDIDVYVDAYVPPVIGGILTITGNPYVNYPLVAVSNLTNAGTPTYQWYSDNVAISGATGLTYTPVAADLNHAVRIDATADGVTSTGTLSSADVTVINKPAMSGGIIIIGYPYVGDTLKALPDLINAGTVTYQWYRGTYSYYSGYTWTAISGETSLTYDIVSADLNRYLRISATSGADVIYSDAFGPITNMPAMSGYITISGKLFVGRSLTADPSHLNDAGNATYSWYRGADVIPGATGLTYKLVATDAGIKIKVMATADGIQGTGTITSSQTNTIQNTPAMGGTVTISGTKKYGSVLTADTSHITYTPSITDDVPTFTWYYDDNGVETIIRVTTTNKYTIDSSAVIGHSIKVKVTANPSFATGQVTSALYGPIATTTYTVTFIGNGGTNPNPSTRSVTFNAAYGSLSTTSRTGYTFAGWYTALTGGTLVTVDTIVTIGANHNLYALWTANMYTVTFVNNGGGSAPSPASMSVFYGSTYGTLASSTRDGYTLRWFTGQTTGTEVTLATNVTLTADQTLYARWTPATYIVSFDGMEGSEPASKTVTFGSTYGTLTASTRIGYTFGGWFTDAVGGTAVTATTTVTIVANQTLHAHWTVKTYTVTFNGNNGTAPTPATRVVTFGSAYGLLSTTSRTNYTFDGWFTAASGGSKVTESTLVSIGNDHILYAHWVGILCTATFDSNGGNAPTMGNVTVVFGSPYGTLATATRTGYTFGGWYTAASGGSVVTTTTNVATSSDHTLYAHWTANQYTVTFNRNGGGTPSKSTMPVTFGSAYGALATISRTGYTFDGWFTAASGGTEIFATTTVAIDSNHVLYAQWTGITFTVTFNANSGSTPEPLSKEVTFGSAYGTLATTTRSGYTFDGWFTSATFGTEVTDATLVSTNSNHNLYAHWIANNYTITFDSDGGSAVTAITQAYGTNVAKPANPTKAGYAFTGWYPAVPATMPAYDQILKAQWTANTYTVTLNGNGGLPLTSTKTVTFDSAYGTLATPSRTGYAFDGWFTLVSGGTEVTDTTIVTTSSNHNLYAHWTANQYTVTFDSNGGDTPSMGSKVVTFGSAYGTLATTSRTGYTFKGWYSSASGGTLTTSATLVSNAANHTLYAQWTAIQYTITFNGNGGGTPSPISKPVTFDSTYGTLATISWTGYTFNGWYDSAVGGTLITSTTLVTNPADDTLYAHWTVNQYTVTFDGNNGITPTPPSKPVTFGSTYGILATTSRIGYAFNGWFTAASGGTQVTSATTVTNASAHTLYAQWTAKQYTITFDGNGGVPSPTTMVVTFDSTYGTLATALRTGYTISGWYTAATGGSEVIAGTTVNITSNQTLYAHWTVNTYKITFDSAGGTAVAAITQAYGTTVAAPANPTRTGYTFTGWSPSLPMPMPAFDQTLTAQWTANQYLVTLNGNGGTPATSTKTVTFGSAYGTLATTTRIGYTFNGWFTASSGGTQVTAATIVSTASAHTLYAQWTINNYTITFNSNGGSAVASITQALGSAIVAPANPTRAGYTFLGWSPALPSTMPIGGAALTAQWGSQYTVKFDRNGGSKPNLPSIIVTLGLPYGTLDDATPTSGRTFTGWFTTATGGSQVTSATIVTNANNHTLYAHWSP